MDDRLERLAKVAYREWKKDFLKMNKPHLDEETLACFMEGKLSPKENDSLKSHILQCSRCAEILAVQMKIKSHEEKEVPAELIDSLKTLVKEQLSAGILEIFLRCKEALLEVVNTSGDVLVGQELVPAPVLRSRNIKDFKDEVTILKDFKEVRVEAKVENERGCAFSLTVVVKEKNTQELIKGLRMALLKDEVELESYATDSGRTCFEHVLLGHYVVEIMDANRTLASVVLDIKI